MPEEYKIDYTGIQVPDIDSIKRTSQQFTDWRRSMGFQTEEEKNAALTAEMQAAQQRFNDQDLWNSEDPYEVYNVYETDPVKQAEFRRNGQIVAGVGSTIATLPFTAGMMGGWTPALVSTATGAAGGHAGAYGGQRLGQYIDGKYGTNLTPALTFTGGLFGGALGGGIGYKGWEGATNQYLINNAFKSGQLKWGQPTSYTAYHQSATPITKFKFPFKRWDVAKHGADPNGAFFTVGQPAGSGFLAERPYTGQFQVKVQKPLIQTGELTGPTKNGLRNAIVRRARRDGADAVFFDGIADNTLQNQQILFAMDNADIGYRGMISTPFKQGNWQLPRGMRNQPYVGEFVVSPKEGLMRRLNTVKDRQNFIRENPVSSYYGYGERHVPEGPWGGGGFVRTMNDEIYSAGEGLIKYQHQLDDVIGDIQYNATLPSGEVGRTDRIGIGYWSGKRPIADIKVSHAANSDKTIDAITDLHELHHATGNTDDRFIYNYLKDNDIINWDNVKPYFKNSEQGEIGAHLSELPDYLGFTKGPGNRYQTAYGKRLINEEDVKNFIRFQKRNGFNQQHTIWGNIKNMPAFLDFMNNHKFAITAPILGGTAISGLTSQQQNIQ